MMSLQLRGEVKEAFEQIKYVTIATVSKEGEPWNSVVFCAHDNEGNIYWGSDANAQHSRNIRDSGGKAFLLIYNSTVAAGTGVGVYIKAYCVELENLSEVVFAHNLLQTRRIIPYWKLEDVQRESPVRLYKATPIQAWTNGEGRKDGVYIDTRETLDG